MRQIVLDTETTGLNAKLGDRIIEIGCVEIVSRRITEEHFHVYVNPEREIDLGATRVHGITLEDLAAKPKFAAIAREFLDYVRGAELIIHNADFDVEFLDMELTRAGLGRLGEHVAGVFDTLAQARELHPGRKNSLDALCERYAVDHSRRTLHGALLDAQLLADVWIAMTRGQESLDITLAGAPSVALPAHEAPSQLLLQVIRATVEELEAHAAMCERIAQESKGQCVWHRLAAAG